MLWKCRKAETYSLLTFATLYWSLLACLVSSDDFPQHCLLALGLGAKFSVLIAFVLFMLSPPNSVGTVAKTLCH